MFAPEFTSWQVDPPPAQHYRCSPNLIEVAQWVQQKWPGFTNLGCYGKRAVRGGGAPSSHSYGAAVDLGYPPQLRELVAGDVCAWLVARSDELHVQAIHDYRGCRLWRAGRTPLEEDACTIWWRAQKPSKITGMGQSWANHLHLETTPRGWGDATPVRDRWAD